VGVHAAQLAADGFDWHRRAARHAHDEPAGFGPIAPTGDIHGANVGGVPYAAIVRVLDDADDFERVPRSIAVHIAQVTPDRAGAGEEVAGHGFVDDADVGCVGRVLAATAAGAADSGHEAFARRDGGFIFRPEVAAEQERNSQGGEVSLGDRVAYSEQLLAGLG